MDKKSLMPVSIKLNKIFILFDSGTTNTKAIFEENWDSKKEIVTLTATRDNLITLEKGNNLTGCSNVVYVGDQQEMHASIAVNGGISFSSDEFISLNQGMIQVCSSIDMVRADIKIRFETPRRTADKIKKLHKLGLHFRQHPNVL